jgi:hypothetical protein
MKLVHPAAAALRALLPAIAITAATFVRTAYGASRYQRLSRESTSA